MYRSTAVTRSVRVEVESRYVPERSRPERDFHFFVYTVRISNEGPRAVKLLSRHWVITDAEGQVQEVQGLGVVGEQPRLQPGGSFEYTSACPLPTAIGTMHGTYEMEDEAGERFEAQIAAFTLAQVGALH